jgi:hypothetical protein
MHGEGCTAQVDMGNRPTQLNYRSKTTGQSNKTGKKYILRVSLGTPFSRGIPIFPSKISSFSIRKIEIPSENDVPRLALNKIQGRYICAVIKGLFGRAPKLSPAPVGILPEGLKKLRTNSTKKPDLFLWRNRSQKAGSSSYFPSFPSLVLRAAILLNDLLKMTSFYNEAALEENPEKSYFLRCQGRAKQA